MYQQDVKTSNTFIPKFSIISNERGSLSRIINLYTKFLENRLGKYVIKKNSLPLKPTTDYGTESTQILKHSQQYNQ